MNKPPTSQPPKPPGNPMELLAKMGIGPEMIGELMNTMVTFMDYTEKSYNVQVQNYNCQVEILNQLKMVNSQLKAINNNILGKP